jgi:hypothetical protein
MRRRENSASFFILVQIQAGPPAFARFAGFGSAGQPKAEPLPRRRFANKAVAPRRSGENLEGGSSRRSGKAAKAARRAVARRAKAARRAVARRAKAEKMPVDWAFKALSQLRNLV